MKDQEQDKVGKDLTKNQSRTDKTLTNAAKFSKSS